MSLLIETVTSPSRISYPRDFLLKYQSMKKEEPSISEKLKPYLSPPQKSNKRVTPLKKEAPSPFVLRPKNDQTPVERAPKHPKKRNTPKDLNNKFGADKENLGLPRSKNPQRSEIKRVPLAPVLTPVHQVSPFVRSGNPRFSVLDTPKTNSPMISNFTSPSPLSPSLIYVPPMLVAIARAASLPEIELTNAGSISAKASVKKNNTESMSSKKTPAPTRSLASSHPAKTSATPLSSVKSNSTPTTARRIPSPLDEHRISQRQKQINYGHNTVGYLRYMLLVPRDRRVPENPRTPKKEQACSKRSWDGQLKKWRRELHLWDPEDPEAFKAMLETDIVKSMLQTSAELSKIYESVKDKIGKEITDDEKEEEEYDDSSKSSNELPTLVEVNKPDEVEAFQVEVSSQADKLHQPVARTLVF